MEIFSKGAFYLGMDKEKFCDFDIHIGRLVVQYTCPHTDKLTPPKDDGPSNRPMEGPTDRQSDGEAL